MRQHRPPRTRSMTKSELRKEIKRRKAAFTREERAALSAAVVNTLLTDGHWQHARTVLLYHSLPDEVATHDLIRQALAEGKNVLLPVVVGDDLELRTYTADEALVTGAFNILEPTGPVFTAYETIDLAIIPGVAFTADGRRLGRGRGYYDRLLARLHPSTFLIGLCWPFQLVDDLPTEPHDRPLNHICS